MTGMILNDITRVHDCISSFMIVETHRWKMLSTASTCYLILFSQMMRWNLICCIHSDKNETFCIYINHPITIFYLSHIILKMILWVFGNEASGLKSLQAHFPFFVGCMAKEMKHLIKAKEVQKRSYKIWLFLRLDFCL